MLILSRVLTIKEEFRHLDQLTLVRGFLCNQQQKSGILNNVHFYSIGQKF
jgi:hypothetical protein